MRKGRRRLVAIILIAHKRGGAFRYPIRNTDRSIGTRLSGRIARLHGNHGMHGAPIDLHFDGTAGQSFGAFLAKGVWLDIIGDTNDYCGKGLSGGRITVPEGPGLGLALNPDVPARPDAMVRRTTAADL